MIGILALAAAGMSWAVREVVDRRQLAQARQEMDRGRFVLALRTLESLASRAPGRGEVEYRLGVCQQHAGRLDEALEAWRRVPSNSSFAGPAFTSGAAIALERGAFELGERMLRGALRHRGPHEPEALELLGRVLRFEDRRAEARELLRRQLAEAPEPIPIVRALWMLDAEQVPIARTRAMFEEAARTHPDDPRVQLGLANLARRAGRLDEAARRLDTCLRARPDDVPTWRARLDWAIAAERPDMARRALDHLPIQRLDPSERLEVEAWFAGRSSDRERERQILIRLLEREPGHPQAFERLAELAVEAVELEDAADYRARKAALDRTRDRYWRLFRLGDDELEARAREMAHLAEDLGRRSEALGWWEAVTRRTPGDAEAGRALARLEGQRRVPDGGRPRVGRSEAPGLARAVAPKDAAPDGPDPASALAFVDEAEDAGLDFRFDAGHSTARHLPETMSGGVGLLDFDVDGWLDVYLPQGGNFPDGPDPGKPGDRLFRNLGDGTFEDATEAAGFPRSTRGYGHGVAVGDFDDDGFPDLFITRFDAIELWRNRGDGTFEDATEASGLGLPAEWPTSAAWADLDGDGDLDLYVCHYLRWDEQRPRTCVDPETGRPIYCDPLLFEAVPDRLFRNDGGRFVDVAEEAGIIDRDGRGLGVVAADLNGDRLVDLYVANDLTGNFLFMNRGGLRFEQVGALAGVASNAGGGYQAGMGVASGDLDGDERPDLGVTNFYGEGTTVYRNLGGGIFADASNAFGMAPSRYLLGFGLAFLDANNDGRLDLASANGMVNDSAPLYPYAMPAQLLLGGPGGRLTDVTERAGPAWTTPRVGRGLAVGDLDNDGRVDVLIVPQNGPLALLRNRTDGGHFVSFLLEGTASARDAVGARVTVNAGGHRRVAWRNGGQSYQSSIDPRLHFGLGPIEAPVSVEVAWPSGLVDRHDVLPVDTGYLLREGEAHPAPLPGYRR